MKKFILVIVLVAGVVIIASATGQGNGPADQKDSLLPALVELFQATQHLLALTADVAIRLVNDLYSAVPESLHCLFGLVFQAGFLLTLVGLWTLFSGARFWQRHF
jgi:hypothetical protein